MMAGWLAECGEMRSQIKSKNGSEARARIRRKSDSDLVTRNYGFLFVFLPFRNPETCETSRRANEQENHLYNVYTQHLMLISCERCGNLN